MSGYYRMYRGSMDHPVFGSEPFTRYQAWEWMIGEAAWKDRTITVGFKGVELLRGQLCKSVRVLASEWKWEQTRVLRFLKRLCAEEMITTDTATGVQRITICNYDIYQSCDDDIATPDATAPQQQRNTTATTIEEVKELKSSISRDAARKTTSEPDEFDEWYAAYPLKKDPGRARKVYATARKKAAPDVLLRAARAYAAECAGKDRQFIKHPATWLNAEAWLNQPDLPAAKQSFDPAASIWQARVGAFNATGTWDAKWGDKPGEPGCQAPQHLLEKAA